MRNYEILQDPDPDREPMVFIQLSEIDPKNMHVQFQQPRDRSVVMTPAPEFRPIGIQFWINEHSRNIPKADLRDLLLGESGITEDDLAEMIESLTIETVRTKPTYSERPESGLVETLQPDPTDPRTHLSDRLSVSIMTKGRHRKLSR